MVKLNWMVIGLKEASHLSSFHYSYPGKTQTPNEARKVYRSLQHARTGHPPPNTRRPSYQLAPTNTSLFRRCWGP